MRDGLDRAVDETPGIVSSLSRIAAWQDAPQHSFVFVRRQSALPVQTLLKDIVHGGVIAIRDAERGKARAAYLIGDVVVGEDERSKAAFHGS